MPNPKEEAAKRPQSPPQTSQSQADETPVEPPEYLSADEAEDEVEQQSEDSFPASDSPSFTPVRHEGSPKDHLPQKKSKH